MPAETLGDGRYRLEEHLGSGGMASVWLATDTRLHRQVAVKLIADVLADDEQWLARFEREARAAASLSHPNIVTVFDFGVDAGRPYIVMAYVPGGSLKERLAEGDLPPAAGLARELLGALAHVHGAGILHRDVKPGNLLIDAEGRSHLTDFGIARPQDATSVTQTGMVLGTMRYLAPEVADGAPATEASDLYSAGCVLREVAGEDAAPPLATVIETLTADRPEDRPRDARAALAMLDGDGRAPDDETADTRVMDGTAHPREPVEALIRSARRSPLFVPLAGLAAIVLLAILVIALAGGGDPPGSEGRPQAAPADAPLSEQLDALDRMIEGAAR
jgi:serine/threonine protein kinase